MNDVSLRVNGTSLDQWTYIKDFTDVLRKYLNIAIEHVYLISLTISDVQFSRISAESPLLTTENLSTLLVISAKKRFWCRALRSCIGQPFGMTADIGN